MFVLDGPGKWQRVQIFDRSRCFLKEVRHFDKILELFAKSIIHAFYRYLRIIVLEIDLINHIIYSIFECFYRLIVLAPAITFTILGTYLHRVLWIKLTCITVLFLKLLCHLFIFPKNDFISNGHSSLFLLRHILWINNLLCFVQLFSVQFINNILLESWTQYLWNIVRNLLWTLHDSAHHFFCTKSNHFIFEVLKSNWIGKVFSLNLILY